MKKDDIIQKIRDVKALAVAENYAQLAGLLDRFEKDMIRKDGERRRSAERKQAILF